MQAKLTVIIGLGVTGLSCAKFLARQHLPFAITDTRAEPPLLPQAKAAFPDVTISLGQLDHALLAAAETIIISPGMAPDDPQLKHYRQQGKAIIGDIELFARAVKAPVIAITGTNAKSTVTTLVGEMLHAAGIDVGVGGNLGLPALDLLEEAHAAYVLELSSFQLETTISLKPTVACILNISPDHLDRHHTMANYIAAKQRVYVNAQSIVCNADDAATFPVGHEYALTFTLRAPGENQFGVAMHDGQKYLAHGERRLMPTADLPVRGTHYQANALAALAIGHAYGLPMTIMLQVLAQFKGLKHRCTFIRKYQDVCYINDSKGTNVGATLAALQGIGDDIHGKIILIAGGVGKGADFTPLLPALKQYVRALILIGADAPRFAQLVEGHLPYVMASDMHDAVMKSAQFAKPHDYVLLSPACASLDMFKNFEHRGDVFTECVAKL